MWAKAYLNKPSRKFVTYHAHLGGSANAKKKMAVLHRAVMRMQRADSDKVLV